MKYKQKESSNKPFYAEKGQFDEDSKHIEESQSEKKSIARRSIQ